MDANIREVGLKQMLRVLCRIESLLGNFRSLNITDTTKITNGQLTDYEIVEGEDGFEYLTEMNYSCLHLGNLE